MIILGKKQFERIYNKMCEIHDKLSVMNEGIRLTVGGTDLTKVIESNQKFMDTLTHFLAMEEKSRMRAAALAEGRKKDLEETPGDTKY